MKVDRAKTLVVLVDDDRAFLRALGRLVSLAGFTVLAFDRPADVLKAPLPDEGGCIVLDLFMQEMDGTALFDRLRAAGNRLPVIVITGPRISTVKLLSIGSSTPGCCTNHLVSQNWWRPLPQPPEQPLRT
jgi:FixJ family two-component response regulator